MIRFCAPLRSLVLAGIVLVAHGPATAVRAATAPDPMIVFLAKGAPDACGPGCSEWIAAEGAFDHDTPRRFQDALAALNNRALPVFFNSRGGLVGAAMAVADILRERRMTAGVARTLPRDCGASGTADAACRRRIRSEPKVTAQLRKDGAGCHSACGYALIGATVRQLGAGVRIGIHRASPAPGATARPAPEVDGMLKLHVLGMGVDPALVDAASAVRPDRLHVLSPDEIARFGIAPRSAHETPWVAVRETAQLLGLLKAVSRSEHTESLLTSLLRLGCISDGWVQVSFRRDLPSNEVGVASSVHTVAGASGFTASGSQAQNKVTYSYDAELDFIRQALAAGEIVITETFQPSTADSWTHVTRISTAGLAAAIGDWRDRCTKPSRDRPNWAAGPSGFPGAGNLAPLFPGARASDVSIESEK